MHSYLHQYDNFETQILKIVSKENSRKYNCINTTLESTLKCTYRSTVKSTYKELNATHHQNNAGIYFLGTHLCYIVKDILIKDIYT